MKDDALCALLADLILLPQETEWVEFKLNNDNPQEIGEYISAISNASALHKKPFGYVVWGVQDGTHEVVGTTFRPRTAKEHGQELENWLGVKLHPRIDFRIHEFLFKNLPIALIEIPPADSTPIRFGDAEFIRVGSYKKRLREHPEKEAALWRVLSRTEFEHGCAMHGVPSDTVLGVIDYPGYFEMAKLPLPDDRAAILERLSSERIVQRIGDNRYDVTNLGAVLFAKNLNDFDRIRRKAL